MNKLSGNFGKGILSNWQPLFCQNTETVKAAVITIGALSIPFASVALWESCRFTCFDIATTCISSSQYKSHYSHKTTHWNAAGEFYQSDRNTGSQEHGAQITEVLTLLSEFFIYQLMHKRNALKRILKIYIKTAPTCFGFNHHHQGAYYSSLLKLLLLK
jgi:hypothetical protein